MWKEIKWFRDVATYDALSHDHDHSFSFLSLFLELTRQSPHSQLYRYLHNLCLFWARMCTSLFFCISEWISWEMMVFVVMYFLIKMITQHQTKIVCTSLSICGRWFLLLLLPLFSFFWQRFFQTFFHQKLFVVFLSPFRKKLDGKKYFRTFFISFLFVLIFLGYWPLRFLCTDVKCCCFPSFFGILVFIR